MSAGIVGMVALFVACDAHAGAMDDFAEDWDELGRTLAVGDFDGDGDGDLAIGVPGELHASGAPRPAVHVLLATGVDQFWQSSVDVVDNGVSGSSEVVLSLVAGDFDDDGRDDLAIGLPHQDVGSAADAGVVHVLYGTAAGLDLVSQVLDQDAPESQDRYGWALAAGDFDGQYGLDLAIGVMGEDSEAGAVSVVYSEAWGLTSPEQVWSQGTSGVPGVSQSGDWLGISLASGDFDEDGYDDLAAGASGEDTSPSALDAGVVNVLYGGSSGLSSAGAQMLYQGHDGAQSSSLSADRFGAALAAGDFDGDGEDDLAVGVPGKDVTAITNAGQVHVFYGDTRVMGLSPTLDELWNQDSTGVEGMAEAYDEFGSALAVGRLEGSADVTDDLVVGVPYENISVSGVDVSDAGAVNVLYGVFSTGLSESNDQVWHEESSSAEDASEAHDRFGFALACGDLDNDGDDDLAVGVPGEHIGSEQDAGQVHLFDGTSSRLTATGDRLLHQDSTWP